MSVSYDSGLALDKAHEMEARVGPSGAPTHLSLGPLNSVTMLRLKGKGKIILSSLATKQRETGEKENPVL